MDYEKLLKKAKKEMPESVQEKERFEIPKVKGHVHGTKTIITNFQQISSHIHRPQEHLLKYLLKELAAPGELRSNGSAAIGRKVSSSECNAKIKQYADEFLFCKDCGKPDTEFVKESTGSFMKCMVCGSKHHIKDLR